MAHRMTRRRQKPNALVAQEVLTSIERVEGSRGEIDEAGIS
jgi:hypothetical protein